LNHAYLAWEGVRPCPNLGPLSERTRAYCGQGGTVDARRLEPSRGRTAISVDRGTS